MLASLDAKESALSRQLYYILAMISGGKALDRLRNCESGNGLEVWRASHEQFEPRVRGRFGGLLQQLISTNFTEDVDASIDRWEAALKRYQDQSKEVVSDNIRIATVLDGLQDTT